MPKKFWQFRNQAADSAELLLYGDISDSSWWGDEVTPKTFADELNALGPLTSLTVRINSGGGDVFAAQTIGNLLEQHTAQVTARIDGLWTDPAAPKTLPLVPENKVVLIASHPDYMMAYGACTYIEDSTQQWVTAQTDRLLRSFVKHQPDRRMLELQARPLPIPDKVDSWFVATVC